MKVTKQRIYAAGFLAAALWLGVIYMIISEHSQKTVTANSAPLYEASRVVTESRIYTISHEKVERAIPKLEQQVNEDLARDTMTEKVKIRKANEDAIEEAVLVQNNITKLSKKDYNILTRIVEAEATDKDKKSKILVANVILNRVKNKEFPDSVEDVVFQNVNGAVQFSPVADGRYYSVPIQESTKESVDRALAGEDYSKGALYFVERALADSDNVSWFDRSLTRLFEYQGHEFYK